jgi:hypothetical protein
MTDRESCPSCGRWMKVRKDGKFAKHSRSSDLWPVVPCEGSDQPAGETEMSDD